MIRNELKSRGKRIVIVAGLLCAFIAGAGLNSADSATALADDWIRAQHEARVVLDTERVLEVVREHRRTATDVWRKTLAEAIVAEALAEDLDPLFVAAIVARESSFKTRIESHAGAVGLMQLRPWVARDLALRSAMEWDGKQTLHDPRLNVRLGVRYYKELFDRFGDEQAALTAYCFGPSRVAQQLRAGTFGGSRYAREILALHERLAGREAGRG
jgi:soluble lytic murein transglycosylase